MIVLCSSYSFAKDGILPLTGLKFFEKGVSARKIIVSLSEKTWLSNQLPVSTEFKIILENPIGFKVNNEGKYSLNASLLISNHTGDTVGYAKKFFGENATFDQSILNSLSLTLGFKKDTPLGSYKLLISFYDETSPSSLNIDFNIELVASNLPLAVSNTLYFTNSYSGYSGASSGTNISEVNTKLDTLNIPISYCHSIKLLNLENLNQSIFERGNYVIMVYDENLNLVGDEVFAKKPKVFFTSFNPSETLNNIFYQVFFKTPKSYSVLFRWESEDQKQVIALVNKFTN